MVFFGMTTFLLVQNGSLALLLHVCLILCVLAFLLVASAGMTLCEFTMPQDVRLVVGPSILWSATGIAS